MALPAKYKLSEIAAVLGTTQSREAVCASTNINMYGLDPAYNSGAKFSDMLSSLRAEKKLSSFCNYDHAAVPAWVNVEMSATTPKIAVISGSGKYQDMSGYSFPGGNYFNFWKSIDYDQSNHLLWWGLGASEIAIYDPIRQYSSKITFGGYWSDYSFSLIKVVGNYVFVCGASNANEAANYIQVFNRGDFNTIKYSPTIKNINGGIYQQVTDIIEDPDNAGSFIIVGLYGRIARFNYAANTVVILDNLGRRVYSCAANYAYFLALTTEDYDYSKRTALPVTSGDSYLNLAYYSAGSNPTFIKAWSYNSIFYYLGIKNGIYKFIRASYSTLYETASGISPVICSDGEAYSKSGYYLYHIDKYDFSQSTYLLTTPINGGLIFKH